MKGQYLDELRHRLRKLPMEEQEEALQFYEEYFEEAGEENFEQAKNTLGSPATVASQILADYATKTLKDPRKSTKKGISAVWFFMLALFAAPMALPVVLTVFLLIFSVIITFGSLLFSAFITAVALFISSLFSVIAGASVVFQHWQTSLFYIGAGLCGIGLSIALFYGTVAIMRKGNIGMAKFLKKLLDKLHAGKERFR